MINKELKLTSIFCICLIMIAFTFNSLCVLNVNAIDDNQTPIERLELQETPLTRDTNNTETANYYKRFTPADLLIEIDQGNYNLYNSGFSFVFWGTSSSNMNIEVTLTLGNLFEGYDFRNNNFILTYHSGNQGNTVKLLNFKTEYANLETTSWQTDFNYSPSTPIPNFDILSGNSYYMPFSAYLVRFVFTFVVNANIYNEFSFNDFTLDLYTDYARGYDLGYNSGYNQGKNDFYSSRYDSGYSDGLRDGIDRNQYNFYTLLSAVIETPINAGLSMLNFDFLGFNMRDFFLAIFTIALIITVLRFILQR